MRHVRLLFFGLQLVACGPEGGGDRLLACQAASPPFESPSIRSLAISVTRENTTDARGPQPQTVFLNREQTTYVAGPDDAPAGLSNVLSQKHVQSARFAAFQGGDDAWSRLVACVTAEYAPFDVLVTDERPPAGPYVEAHFGGDGTELALPGDVGGIAPIDSNHCSVIDSAVVFIFSALYGSNVDAMCNAGAQEIAHAFSLDHELLCEDPMSYLGGCGPKHFQDVEASCGEYEARGCTCDRSSQNSVRTLYVKIGPMKTNANTPLILSVQPMKPHYLTSSRVEIAATAFSPEGFIRSAMLVWTDLDGHDQSVPLCPQENDRYVATVELGPVAGDRFFVIRAEDTSGNLTLSPRLRVRVVDN
jgi:hypothetical protein